MRFLIILFLLCNVSYSADTIGRIVGFWDNTNSVLKGPKEDIDGAFKVISMGGCNNGLLDDVQVTVSDGVDSVIKTTSSQVASTYTFTGGVFSGKKLYWFETEFTASDLTTNNIDDGMLNVTCEFRKSTFTNVSETLSIYQGVPTFVDYYIDADNGDDMDAGTEGAPLLTLREALDKTLETATPVGADDKVRLFLKRGTTAVYTWTQPVSSSTQNEIAVHIQPYSSGATPVLRGDGTSGGRVNHVVFDSLTVDMSDGSTGWTHFGNHLTTNTDGLLIVRDSTVTHPSGRGGATFENSPWVATSWTYKAWCIGTNITDINRRPTGGQISRLIDTEISIIAQDCINDPDCAIGCDISDYSDTGGSHLDGCQWTTGGIKNAIVYCIYDHNVEETQHFFSDLAVEDIFIANYLGVDDTAGNVPPLAQFGKSTTDPTVTNVVVVHCGLTNGKFLWVPDSNFPDCIVDESYFADLNAGTLGTEATIGNGAVTLNAATATADDNYSWVVTGDPLFVNGVYGTGIYTGTENDYRPQSGSSLDGLTTNQYVEGDLFGNSVSATGATLGPLQLFTGSIGAEFYKNILERFSP